MWDALRSLPVKFLMITIIAVLIFVGIVVTIALRNGADIDLSVVKISWASATKSIQDKLDEANSLLRQESKKTANLTEQNNVLLNEVSASRQKVIQYEQYLSNANQQLEQNSADIRQYEHHLTELRQQVAQLNLALREKGSQISQLNEKKTLRFDIPNAPDSSRSLEKRLQSKYDELRKENTAYESLKVKCEEGNSFYGQECSKAGEKKGIVDAIKLEIESIERQLSENKRFSR